MMNCVNASFGDASLAADVLYMLVNANVTCRMESEFLCSGRESYYVVSKCKRHQFTFCAH